MTDFRKITAAFLAVIMLAAPCYAFADELAVGDIVKENFDTAEDGTDYWDLTEYIKENSQMFSRFGTHTTPSIWTKLPDVGMKQYMWISSAALETALRDKGTINESRTAVVEGGSFSLGRDGIEQAQAWYNIFTLKNPITSGVHRLSFDVETPSDITSYANPLMYFYDFEPDDGFFGTTSGYGTVPIWVGFNGSNLFFCTNRIVPDSGKSEYVTNWQGVPAASFGAGTHKMDVIIDADNKCINFFVDGTFNRSSVYTGEGIKSFALYTNKVAGNWKASDGGLATIKFDNFEQERLASPACSFNVTDGAYDVPSDTVPTFTFGASVEKSVADSIIIYKDGKVLENIERILSEDGKVITFNMELDYSAGYKFEMPAGNRAVNRAPIIESEVSFRTEHRPTNVVVVSESKPVYTKGEDYTATVTLTNTSGSSVQATYVAAFYDSEGRMFDIDYTVATLGANAEETPLSVKLSASDKEVVTVKTFLIDALHTMNPLVTAID